MASCTMAFSASSAMRPGSRKGAALAQCRHAQLDRAGARLPDPVAIAVAVARTLDCRLHQAPGGKATTSRNRSASWVFSTSARGFIISMSYRCSRIRLMLQPDLTGEPSMTSAAHNTGRDH